jgi:LysR family glycine cleavage system transcriptional activator
LSKRALNVSSLGALVGFEAAARRGSFRLAALELNVTPSAISRQIQHLEEEFGVRLFARIHRGVILTPEGAEIYSTVGQAFESISDTIARTRSSNRGKTVTLATTHAFGYFWLMSKVNAFWRAHPEIVLNQVISDDVAETRLSTIDLRIRYCSAPEADEEGVKLFGDEIYPVCTPELLARFGQVNDVKKLAKLPLIDGSSSNSAWTPWSVWLRTMAFDHVVPNYRRVSSYIIAVQAALDGQGVILGWHRLIEGHLKSGQLVKLSKLSMPSPWDYYAIWSAKRGLRPEAETLLQWLTQAP